MSHRTIVVLGAITLVLLLAALLLTGQRQSGPLEQAGLVVPGLRDQVNELSAVDLSAADGERIVELRRVTQGWVVHNRDGYEADFRAVQDFLRELAQARRVEPRTARPDLHARLGLADIGSEEATGLLVEFPDSDLPAVLLGSQDSLTSGRFVRLRDEAQTWLSDRPLAAATDSINWLERSVMDIPASELAEVRIGHADGETLRLRPADDDGDHWVLLDVPEGREAGPRWEVRPVANSLASIVFTDVRSHSGEIPEDAVRASYVTRDGLLFNAALFADDRGRWLHFNVTLADSPGSDEDAAEQLLLDAVAVDARLSPWEFALDQRKFEVMTRRMEDLLAPLPE